MNVSQILKSKGNSDVVTLPANATLHDAAKTLSQHKIGAVVVCNGENAVCGILSERDIVRHISQKDMSALNQPLSIVMTKTVISCTSSHSSDDILTLMTQNRFRHVPVIDDENLAGIISIGDVVKAKLTALQMENEAMQDMITRY